MAKTENIFFRAEQALVNKLTEHYGSANLAASRITEALVYLREGTLQELKGKFTPTEIIFLIIILDGKTIEPDFTTSKESIVPFIRKAYTLSSPEQKKAVNITALVSELEELTSAQLYFLFDYCFMFYKQEGTTINAYAANIA